MRKSVVTSNIAARRGMKSDGIGVSPVSHRATVRSTTPNSEATLARWTSRSVRSWPNRFPFCDMDRRLGSWTYFVKPKCPEPAKRANFPIRCSGDAHSDRPARERAGRGRDPIADGCTERSDGGGGEGLRRGVAAHEERQRETVERAAGQTLSSWHALPHRAGSRPLDSGRSDRHRYRRSLRLLQDRYRTS
jgi:hypothetical protein